MMERLLVVQNVFKREKMLGTKRYENSKRLVFSECLKSIFEKISAEELLSRCQTSLAENPNESAHAESWGKCSKTSVHGKIDLLLTVADTFCVFNTGTGAQVRLWKLVAIKLLELIPQKC